MRRFLDTLIFNWLISGTDAHAKNYGFLLADGSQVRLSPLYDLSSSLHYPVAIPPQKAKLAMMIGGTYRVSHMSGEAWEKAAGEWKLDRRVVMDRVVEMTKDISNTAIDQVTRCRDSQERSWKGSLTFSRIERPRSDSRPLPSQRGRGGRAIARSAAHQLFRDACSPAGCIRVRGISGAAVSLPERLRR